MAAAGRSIGDINESNGPAGGEQAGSGDKWQDYIGTATQGIMTHSPLR